MYCCSNSAPQPEIYLSDLIATLNTSPSQTTLQRALVELTQTTIPPPPPSAPSSSADSLATAMALYQRTAIEQKGYGMIVKIAISPGTLALTEEPLFSLPSALFSKEVLTMTKDPESTLNTVIATAVKALSKDKQVAFLELHNSKTRPGVFLGIWQTNAFGLGSDNDESGIFELASRFNHSCFSNAVHSWNYNTKKMEIHATKAIPEGVEITMSYLSFEEIIQSCARRRTMLQARYGFICSCHACTSPDNTKSVARRTELAMLDGELSRGNFSPGMNTARAMKNLRRML